MLIHRMLSLLESKSCTEFDIVRILSVKDTRDYEEISDGVWAPVRGSGTESQCARCGRFHEVHAEVILGDGKTTVVGTGCMKRGSMLAKKANSAARVAKKLAQMENELKALRKRQKKYLKVKEHVSSMMVPRIEKTPIDDIRYQIQIGDVKARRFYSKDSQREKEDVHSVVRAWRDKQIIKLVDRKPPIGGYNIAIEELEINIKKAKARLKKAIS